MALYITAVVNVLTYGNARKTADDNDTCDAVAAVLAVFLSWKPKNVKNCLPEKSLLAHDVL